MLQSRREFADENAIALAAGMLRAGKLVAFPTETVYGLGADATSDAAVLRVYTAKTRPSFNPMIVHLADLKGALAQGVFSAEALDLAEAFWPGPLTLVLPLAPTANVSPLARAGLPSVALRTPAHPVARALVAAAGRPIVAPSANRSGRISPTTAEHVAGDLDGRIDLILDGGSTAVGIESTIVACLGTSPRLLRPGGVARDAIERVLGRGIDTQAPSTAGPIIAPGMLATHYAPRAVLRLEARDARPDEAVLDFGASLGDGAAPVFAYLDLSPTGDLTEAATNLFAHLHALDASGAATIAVAPVPAGGLGEAINDRLVRAAAPRSDQA